MNNTPAIYFPSKDEITNFHFVAQTAAQSGLYTGIGSEQKILMIILAARELGIPILQALNGGLWNIQGKIEISARLMSSMIRRAGHSIKIVTSDSKECVLEGTRKDNGDTFTCKFTIEDAQRAGLIKPGGVWTKYPEDMIYARALSRLARRLFADVIGTAYVEGEIREEKLEMSDAVVIDEDPELLPEPPKRIAPNNSAPVISQEQVEEISKTVSHCSDTFKAEVKAYLTKVKKNTFNELNEFQFNNIMLKAVPEMEAYQAGLKEVVA